MDPNVMYDFLSCILSVLLFAAAFFCFKKHMNTKRKRYIGEIRHGGVVKLFSVLKDAILP